MVLFPPATAAQVNEAGAILGKRIPESLANFWRFSNGANLFLNDSGLHGIGLASTDLLVELNQEEMKHYGSLPLAPYLVIARAQGSGDFLVIELGTGRVVDGVHAEQPHEWRVVADSLEQWLHRLLEESGRYFWLEELMREPAN